MYPGFALEVERGQLVCMLLLDGPGCWCCRSLLWVEKQVFSQGQFRHSLGKLLCGAVIPTPVKIRCLSRFFNLCPYFHCSEILPGLSAGLRCLQTSSIFGRVQKALHQAFWSFLSRQDRKRKFFDLWHPYALLPLPSVFHLTSGVL